MDKRIVIATLVLLSGITACFDGNPASQSVVETTVRLEGSIGQTTRGVIGSEYGEDLAVVFSPSG